MLGVVPERIVIMALAAKSGAEQNRIGGSREELAKTPLLDLTNR